MGDLQSKFNAIAAGDSIYICAWRITPSQKLMGEGSPGKSFLEIIRDSMNIGVKVRAMLRYVPFSGVVTEDHNEENIAFVQELYAAGVLGSASTAVLDDRLPEGAPSSHHQKFVILKLAAITGLTSAV